MAVVNKTITAVPAGIVRIDIYESASAGGLYTKSQEINVTLGQTLIAVTVQENFWYKFKQIDSLGVGSQFSSAWQYTLDNRQCTVSGQCRDASGFPAVGVIVTATLLAQTLVTNDNDQVAGSVSITTGTTGDWSLRLWKTSLLKDTFAKYIITFTKEGFDESRTVTVPDQDTIDYEDLPLAGSLSSDFNIGFEVDPDSLKWFVEENKFLTFMASEGESRLSTLPGVTGKIRLVKEEDTLDSDGEVVSTAITTILDWVTAEIEGMSIRYLYDSVGLVPTSSTIRYLTDVEIAGLGGEKIRSKPFKVKFV